MAFSGTELRRGFRSEVDACSVITIGDKPSANTASSRHAVGWNLLRRCPRFGCDSADDCRCQSASPSAFHGWRIVTGQGDSIVTKVDLSASNRGLFFVGRNASGAWVAQDQRGTRGGLFRDQTKAVRYALSENGNRPEGIILVAGLVELDVNAKPRLPDHLVVVSQNKVVPIRRSRRAQQPALHLVAKG